MRSRVTGVDAGFLVLFLVGIPDRSSLRSMLPLRVAFRVCGLSRCSLSFVTWARSSASLSSRSGFSSNWSRGASGEGVLPFEEGPEFVSLEECLDSMVFTGVDEVQYEVVDDELDVTVPVDKDVTQERVVLLANTGLETSGFSFGETEVRVFGLLHVILGDAPRPETRGSVSCAGRGCTAPLRR